MIGQLYAAPAEVLWFLVNVTTVLVTSWALYEAWTDHQTVKRFNGRAREVATRGDIRRALERISKAGILTVAAIPTLFIDDNPQLIGPVGLLMLVPLIMLYGSLADIRERRRLVVIIANETRAGAGLPPRPPK
jgi:hypothetical protein